MLPAQGTINETGAIFRCSLRTASCQPFVLETQANILLDDNDELLKSEIRDFQWLGAAMDGGASDEDAFIACAPRLQAVFQGELMMNGICYWLNNTRAGAVPNSVQKLLLSLRHKHFQTRKENGKSIYYYMLAQQGFSVHKPPFEKEILIGAPGGHNWKGSVVLHSKKEDHIVMPNQMNLHLSDDSYLGYALSSGYFMESTSKRLLYLATAPRANNQSGEAYIYDYNAQGFIKHCSFYGQQYGEYFGYAILGEDINGDGLTDVVVGAPLHSLQDSFDNGAIYVFVNKGGVSTVKLKASSFKLI